MYENEEKSQRKKSISGLKKEIKLILGHQILEAKKLINRRNIVNPLVKIDCYDYIYEGKIEYIKNGEVLAAVDFGEGKCDKTVTKTVDGLNREIKLNKKGKNPQ